MDILLHICCGPCLIYPFSVLREKFKVQGFYYNPNIYPQEEYAKRKDALGVLEEYFKLPVIYPDYCQSDYFSCLEGKDCQVRPRRCEICYNLRLKKTAQYAIDNGYKVFSTTLLVSPYQDHQLLKKCGLRLAQESGLEFYYEDFRPGFKEAQLEAKTIGIYRQKYCGCKFSIEDAKNEKQAH
ncbi:MAG: epoxyqueuosine reductase QueH [Candidatus Omnitrophica bacterium]|jgi:hypothetical protein|nr:epoxyqueuosine reductase QueH [Candidatus Omnitrophota bacterium]